MGKDFKPYSAVLSTSGSVQFLVSGKNSKLATRLKGITLIVSLQWHLSRGEVYPKADVWGPENRGKCKDLRNSDKGWIVTVIEKLSLLRGDIN